MTNNHVLDRLTEIREASEVSDDLAFEMLDTLIDELEQEIENDS